MQLCLTVICWAQRWVEERGARQVLLGVSAKWPSTCQYQVSGRERRRESMHVWHLSGEEERWDCCCRMNREDAVDFFKKIVVSHYTNKLRVKNVFLTPPYLSCEREIISTCLSHYTELGCFLGCPWVHSLFYYKRRVPWQLWGDFFSKWFYHWTRAQIAWISADWQHILYASALWHRLMSCPSLSGGMLHTLTQIQLKLMSSP